MKNNTIFKSLIILTLAFAIIISGCQTNPTNISGNNSQNSPVQGTFNLQTFNPDAQISAKTFQSEAEYLSFIKNSQSGISGGGFRSGLMMEKELSSVAMDLTPAPTMVNANEGDYSTTNNQVNLVDEADIIKTDGEYIYTISGGTLFIVKAYPGEDAKTVSTINFNSTPQGIFIKGNKLAIFGYLYDREFYKTLGFTPRYEMTFFNIYDITDKKNPRLEKSYKFEGSYFQARMTGDYAYIVLTSGLDKRGGIITPLIMDGATMLPLPVDKIHYFPIPYNYPQLETIHAISLTDDTLTSESLVVESSTNAYMSEKNMYITYTEYINEWEIRQKVTMDLLIDSLSDSDKLLVEKIKNTDNDVLSQAEKEQKILEIIYDYLGYLPPDEQDKVNEDIDNKTQEKLSEYKYMEYTVINKVSLDKSKITIGASGKTPGHIISQFSMDENNNVFRIATTVSQRWSPIYYNAAETATVSSGVVSEKMVAPPQNGMTESTNNVYALDSDMKIIGSLVGLAKGEQVYSTRFIGDRLYMVTFKQLDPFFVIDLSDPKNIKELGKLKLPGFSRYLHPYDENTIIGIGRDATDSGRTEGLKISLFDVTDVKNPKEVAKFVTSEKYAQSTAEWEHKAFLMSKEKQILVIPAYNYNYDYMGKTAEQQYNGAMVFNITPTSITLKGIVDHSKGVDNYYGPLVERSLYISDMLYTKSQGLIRINSIGDLASVNEVKLEESNSGPYKIV